MVADPVVDAVNKNTKPSIFRHYISFLSTICTKLWESNAYFQIKDSTRVCTLLHKFRNFQYISLFTLHWGKEFPKRYTVYLKMKVSVIFSQVLFLPSHPSYQQQRTKGL